MSYEDMTAEERAIAQAEARFGKYRNLSTDELIAIREVHERDLADWTRQFENPVRPEQKTDAWTEMKYVRERLDFINNLLGETKRARK